MPKGCSIANTGDGKTLAAVAKAFTRLKNESDLHVYANLHINLPRCHYTPHMFLDFEHLGKCMVIYDDVSNARVLERYAGVCANLSRKTFMDLLFTGQADKMIPKQIREIMDYRLHPKIRGNTLYIVEKRRGKPALKYQFRNVFNTIGKLYDTNEIVPMTLESDIIREIIKLSKTKRDVEMYLMVYSGNYQKRERLMKKILKKMKLGPDEENNNNNLMYKLYIANKLYNISHNKIAHKLNRNRTSISLKLKEIEYELNEFVTQFYD